MAANYHREHSDDGVADRVNSCGTSAVLRRASYRRIAPAAVRPAHALVKLADGELLALGLEHRAVESRRLGENLLALASGFSSALDRSFAAPFVPRKWGR